MTKHLLIASLILAACGTNDPVESTDPFGNQGTASQNAAELLGKRDAITNDKIAGVYESKGTSSGIYETDSFYTVTNHWTHRVELRANQISTVLNCEVTYSEPGRAPKTLAPFVLQSAELLADGYRVTQPGTKAESDPVSQSECKVDNKPMTWAFCDHDVSYPTLPEGASACLGRDDAELVSVVRVDADRATVESWGVKVAN